MIGQNILELDRTGRDHWAGCLPTGGGWIQPRELQGLAGVFFGLFFLIITAIFMILISSSRTGKAGWTPVAIGNLPSSKSTETLWWRNRSVRAMSSDAGPLKSAPAIESFSNFAPDSGLSPFLTLEKIIQLQIGRSNSVDLLFLFCFKKQLSKKKTCSTILAK